MGWRGTLILAILVAGAATAFLLSPVPPDELPDTTLLGEPRYRDPEEPSTPLLEFAPDEIARFTLGYGDEVVSVAREGTQWRGAADDRNLGDFLAYVSQTKLLSTVDQGELAEFGLDAPERRILLERKAGDPLVLLIGERTPAGTSVYVRRPDGPVVITGALIVWEFDKAFAAVTGRKPLL